jgi:predicted Rossmann-fold nucleotide-binding protein
VVSGDAVHVTRLFGHAAEKIPSTHDQGNLHAEFVDLFDLAGNGMDEIGFNSKTFGSGERFTRKFEKDAFESKHVLTSIMRAGCIGETRRNNVILSTGPRLWNTLMTYEWPDDRWKPPNEDTAAFRAERDRCVAEVKAKLAGASPVIAVSGWGTDDLSADYFAGVAALAACLAKNKFPLLTGGLGGAMHAVAANYLLYNGPLTIGILPKGSLTRAQAAYQQHFRQIQNVETQLDAKDSLGRHTHHGPNSRNHVLIYSGDIIVCLPGGEGSMAEAEMAKDWYKKSAIVAFDPEVSCNKTAELDPWRNKIKALGIELLTSGDAVCNWLLSRR